MEMHGGQYLDLLASASVSASEPIEVVLFSGGRGGASIAQTLVSHEQVRLRVVVNAYDDGLSTGVLYAEDLPVWQPGHGGEADLSNIEAEFRV